MTQRSLIATAALGACGLAVVLFLEVRDPGPAITASAKTEREVLAPEKVAQLGKQAGRAISDEVAVVTATQGEPLKAAPASYVKSVEKFLALPLELGVGKPVSVAKALAESLEAEHVPRPEQKRIVNRLGQYFYNQSVIGGRQGYPRATKIKLLQLAISHLEEGRSL